MIAPEVKTEVLAVREALGFARLPHWGVVDILGPDAPAFLQNRTTNDVVALKPGEGHLNAIVDRQAKVQGVFSLHRLENGARLLFEDRALLPQIVAEIEKFHIIEQFTTTDVSASFDVLTLQGSRSRKVLTATLQGFRELPDYGWQEGTLADQSVWLTRRSLSGEEGYVLLVPQGAADTIERALQAAAKELGLSWTVLSEEALNVLRIEAGWPRFGVDMTTDTLFPETGLQQQAVSYTKGCFLGQETIARVKTYGAVQHALCGLLFPQDFTDLPPVGTSLVVDGQTVGTLYSSVYSPTLERPIALAYLGKAWRTPGKTLSLSLGGKTVVATVTLLPFVSKMSAQDALHRGLRAYSEGNEEDAVQALREAVQLDDTLVDAFEALGVILGRQEQVDEAMAMMHKVLELDPDHVLAHTNLSIYWLKKGDKDKAEEEKAKATVAGMRKKAKEAGFTLPDPEELRRQQEAKLLERVAMFEEALKFSPDDPLGNFGLGSALVELKRYADAIAPLEKTIAAQPKHTVAYLSLGKAFQETGQLERAREIFEKGIEVASARGDLMPLQDMQKRLAEVTKQPQL